MSFSNVSCEKESEFEEKESLSNNYFNEKLEIDNKIQIHSEITCERNVIDNPSIEITVATLMNQPQIQISRIDEEEGDITSKSQTGESLSTPRKPLRHVLMEKRIRSRKKSKILKNQTRREGFPPRRKAGRNVRTKVKKKREAMREEESSEEKMSKERVCLEEMPKRGKRGLIGGKAKAKPPKEDFSGSHESDEDADSFHFYRISLGYFQKFRDVQGASTSTRHETSSYKASPSFKSPRLNANNSEERELLELQRWGMASLITDDNVILETDKVEANVNSSENFETDETNLKDFTVNRSLYQDLSNINMALVDVRQTERDAEFKSSTVKPKIYSKSDTPLTGNINYKWIQTSDSISVEIKCPLYVVSSHQVSVKTTPFSLEINIKSLNESEWTQFFNCDLAGRISPEGSTWCLGPFPSILIFLKKHAHDFWKSLTKSPAEPLSDTLIDRSQTDVDEIYQPAVLDIIKTLSLIEINKTCTKDPINSNKNKSEGCSYTTELRDVMESGEDCKKVEKFD